MQITKLQTAERVPFNLDGRKLFIDPRAEIIHLCLKPGEVLATHTNPFDVAIFVVEGHGKAESDGAVADIVANDCLSIPSGAQRGLSNTGNGNLRVLVFKVF